MENNISAVQESWFTEGAETEQVSTLLYCLDEGGEDILGYTGITLGEREVHETVANKFERFIPCECACFNKRYQLEGETAESYITALYSLI